MQQQMQQPQIDLSKTTAINPENGKVWSQGVVLRKVSKFVTGTSEDGIMPIPVFYDAETGEICMDTLPKELREEYK